MSASEKEREKIRNHSKAALCCCPKAKHVQELEMNIAVRVRLNFKPNTRRL